MTSPVKKASGLREERIREECVQVLLPMGREAEVVGRTLSNAGLPFRTCDAISDLVASVRTGAASTLLLTDRTLKPESAQRLRDAMAAQPVWSDVPVVMLVRGDAMATSHTPAWLQALAPATSVTVLERPTRPRTLLQALRAALRHRRRQHDLREALAALQEHAETLEGQVEERTQQVRALALKLTMAEQEERRRIAQILHDDLQQLLYGLGMKVNLLRRSLAETEDSTSTPQASADLDEMSDWLDRAVTTTRHLTADLSPPLDEQEGLTDTVTWLRHQMQDLHGLDVAVEANRPWPIPDQDLHVLLFRIVRELLFNVKKHAGVDRATVRLTEEDGHLVIRVLDGGDGFDAEAMLENHAHGGFGLENVQERLELAGGRLEIHSAPGRGTTVAIHVPAPSA
jgi:signal transduction histidine kinase